MHGQVSVRDRHRYTSNIISSLLVRVWTGAGFAAMAFALFLLLTSRFDTYALSQMLSFRLLLMFYGYGAFCALVIEGLSWKMRRVSGPLKFILYVAAGMGFFLVRGIDPSSIIAGFVGAVSALVFWAGMVLASRDRKFRLVFSVIAPLVLLFVMQWDFTTKRGWVETVAPTSYTASFDFFHGEHAVPVYAEEGQTVHFEVTFDEHNQGGHGLHVRSHDRSRVPMFKDSDNRLSFLAERSGMYRIMVTGDQLRGSFKVDWEIHSIILKLNRSTAWR